MAPRFFDMVTTISDNETANIKMEAQGLTKAMGNEIKEVGKFTLKRL